MLSWVKRIEVQRAQKAILHITKERKEFSMVKKTCQQEIAQTAQINKEANHREAINTVEQCMNPEDVWHMVGTVKAVGELINLSESAEFLQGRCQET